MANPTHRSNVAPGVAPDASAIAADLRLSVTRLARQLRRQSEAGLTPTQLSALATIERHGPLSLGELADHERVAPPTMTRVVAKLTEASLVTRTDDPTDRRSSLVAVTRTGRTLLDRSRTRKAAWLTARVAQLPPTQQAELAAALDALDALVTLDRGAP